MASLTNEQWLTEINRQLTLGLDKRETAHLYVTLELIQRIADSFDWSHSLAAEAVGKMEIDVDDYFLNYNKEALDDTLRLAVEAFKKAYRAVEQRFGMSTAQSYIASAIPRLNMQLKYNGS